MFITPSSSDDVLANSMGEKPDSCVELYRVPPVDQKLSGLIPLFLPSNKRNRHSNVKPLIDTSWEQCKTYPAT